LTPPDESRGPLTHPTQEELLGAAPLLAWIDEYFLRTDPFAFKPHSFRSTVRLITEGFDVDPNGVFCIGSGAIGLSLNPAKIAEGQLKAFGASSDLDLAIISEVHFETAWRDLRKAAQATSVEIDDVILQNLKWQKKRFFDGAIIANKLLPALSFGNQWITATPRVAQEISILLDREVEVNYWIYRDYWSLRNYVAAGIVRCREGLA
jgi:hypothetical protein